MDHVPSARNCTTSSGASTKSPKFQIRSAHLRWDVDASSLQNSKTTVPMKKSKIFRANLELRWDHRLKPGSRSCSPNGRVPGTKQGPRFKTRSQILYATCWRLF